MNGQFYRPLNKFTQDCMTQMFGRGFSRIRADIAVIQEDELCEDCREAKCTCSFEKITKRAKTRGEEIEND